MWACVEYGWSSKQPSENVTLNPWHFVVYCIVLYIYIHIALLVAHADSELVLYTERTFLKRKWVSIFFRNSKWVWGSAISRRLVYLVFTDNQNKPAAGDWQISELKAYVAQRPTTALEKRSLGSLKLIGVAEKLVRYSCFPQTATPCIGPKT